MIRIISAYSNTIKHQIKQINKSKELGNLDLDIIYEYQFN